MTENAQISLLTTLQRLVFDRANISGLATSLAWAQDPVIPMKVPNISRLSPLFFPDLDSQVSGGEGVHNISAVAVVFTG